MKNIFLKKNVMPTLCGGGQADDDDFSWIYDCNYTWEWKSILKKKAATHLPVQV